MVGDVHGGGHIASPDGTWLAMAAPKTASGMREPALLTKATSTI